jgi:sugar/nucleoside kinase (ribokinase family)
MNNETIDFLAIGDVFIDTFIALDPDCAKVTCDENGANCTLSMKFGDKLPYISATPIVAVGNAGNAAVAGARLGTSSALLTITGDDDDGKKIWNKLESEKVLPYFMKKEPLMPSNNAYVLQYGPERTILVKQAEYPYTVPKDLLAQHMPSWIYFTSISHNTLSFHKEIAAWIKENPSVKLAFQPGTFQLQLGAEALKEIYEVTYAFFCNKEEAQRILNKPTADFPELHAGIRSLGPKLVIITDGPKGLTASDANDNGYFLPMYPDPKSPVSRTGAGDATSSTICIALHSGLPLEEAIMWGPINSMNVVQYVGAQTGLLHREELTNFLKNAPAEYKVTKLF